ncbi:expressed protein [Echinococcus multilocularis]|uniref:Expressed protein n=1 Tax=Echinococcus multilocularis TaxID=6211 RepID=A0A087VZW1_ECHMU|nr:expressed protein [Echinococcus multilocularis]
MLCLLYFSLMLYYFVYAPITPPQKTKVGNYKKYNNVCVRLYSVFPSGSYCLVYIYILINRRSALLLFECATLFAYGCIRKDRPTIRFTHLKTFCGMAQVSCIYNSQR